MNDAISDSAGEQLAVLEYRYGHEILSISIATDNLLDALNLLRINSPDLAHITSLAATNLAYLAGLAAGHERVPELSACGEEVAALKRNIATAVSLPVQDTAESLVSKAKGER